MKVLETNMRSIVAGCMVGLWVCAAGWGQADEPMAPEAAPAATQAAPTPALEVPPAEPTAGATRAAGGEPGAASEPDAELAAASAPSIGPATQAAALRIAGVPAREWLNTAGMIQGHNYEGRLWVLGVVEPWSERSRRAAAELAGVGKAWVPRGVDVLLVTVSPAEEVRQYPAVTSLPVPIGTGSSLPLVLGLEVLPEVYLVGPDFGVAWSGPVAGLGDAVERYDEPLAPGGLCRRGEPVEQSAEPGEGGVSSG